VPDDCLLATNTSSLSVSAIAARLRVPGRVAEMHFFNPAPVMPLVEVVSGLDTARETAEQVAAAAARWGKTPVHVGSTPGFIVNRVARPFYGEGLRALEERAADPATIDAVLRESGGFRMGPLELTDLIGQDVNDAVNRSVWAGFGHDPRYAPSLAQRALVDAGRLGRKTGQGFYRYGPGAPRPEPATATAAPAPGEVTVTGDWGPWEPLWLRIQKAGVRVLRHSGTGPPTADLGDLMVVPTTGRTATQLAADYGRPVVVVDLALDPAAAGRFAVAGANGCPQPALEPAVGLLQACGAAVSVLGDLPGLLVARTVAMLVNEAAEVVGRGVATTTDVDTALRLGAGYPVGPLACGDAVGARWVVTLLDALAGFYGGGRYRACPTLRQVALTGERLHES
jgi:3-hydroxybutyryl-CoA dehydrogenase